MRNLTFAFIVILFSCDSTDRHLLLTSQIDDGCYELELTLGYESAIVKGHEIGWNNELFEISIHEELSHIVTDGQKLRIKANSQMINCNWRCRNTMPRAGFSTSDAFNRRVFYQEMIDQLLNGQKFKMWIQFEEPQYLLIN